MRLFDSELDKWVRIVGFAGGRGLADKLRQLGLAPGDKVRVVRHAPLGGPVMVEVEGRSIALGRGVAQRINVEEISCDSH